MSHKASYFRALTVALGRGSPLLFDFLGIDLSWDTLPGYQEYRFASDVFWGKGQWGRLWAKRIRPKIRKHEHMLLHQIYKERTDAMRQQCLDRMFDKARRDIGGHYT